MVARPERSPPSDPENCIRRRACSTASFQAIQSSSRRHRRQLPRAGRADPLTGAADSMRQGSSSNASTGSTLLSGLALPLRLAGLWSPAGHRRRPKSLWSPTANLRRPLIRSYRVASVTVSSAQPVLYGASVVSLFFGAHSIRNLASCPFQLPPMPIHTWPAMPCQGGPRQSVACLIHSTSLAPSPPALADLRVPYRPSCALLTRPSSPKSCLLQAIVFREWSPWPRTVASD